MTEAPNDSQASDLTSESLGRPFGVAPLRGQHVLLRLIIPEDYRFLRVAELSGDLGVRWRFRGSTASPEQWSQSLWQSTLAQYLVVRTDDPTPLGLVAAYRANFQDGHAYLAAETFGGRRPAPVMLFGVALFIDYLFACWNFHKLYLEVVEYNMDQFESGIGRLFDVEGRLRHHVWYDGRRWDQLLLALYRDTWRRESARVLVAARGPDEVHMTVRLPSLQPDDVSGR